MAAIDPISAVANALGSLFNGVSSIFTSSNQVDIEQAKVEQLNEQLKIETQKGENLALVEALKLRQVQANANLMAAKSEQTGKNIKTGIIGLVIGVVGFFVYKIVMKSTPEATLPTYQPL